jgi:imidazolonepropionase-like amidohydrolase
LHDELALLVEAGLTPLESLRTATVNPPQFFGMKDMGSIEPGRKANLFVVEANPALNIANTKKISAVVMRGTLHTRGQLDELLNRSARIAFSQSQR